MGPIMTKQQLIEMASGIILDDDHFSLTDAADRADMGVGLATEILRYFRKQPPTCKPDCGDCKKHAKNLK